MARAPRLLLSQSYYHIIVRANNRMTVFKSEEDYQYYFSLIIRFKEELPFDLYHYCLMPNHIHMQIKTHEAKKFSLFMKKINLAYFYYYKKKYKWVGHLWQNRFRSQPIGKDDYFIQCGKYIELNAVRAGIVKFPHEYPYSSYGYYFYGKTNPILTEDIFFNDLGANNKERRKSYNEMLIDDIVLATYAKKIWGSNNQRYNEYRKIYYNTKN